MAFAQAKSASVEAWVKSFTADGTVDLNKLFKGSGGLSIKLDGEDRILGGGGPSGSGSSAAGTQNVDKPSGLEVRRASSNLDSIKVGSSTVAYNRDEWKHWDKAGSCGNWDVRREVLSVEAVKGSLVLVDANGKETSDKSKACDVKSGKWHDPYTGKAYTDPKELDIDHMIPLSYAASHGGQAWSAEKKRQYANDMGNANHLIAVQAGANRTKGDKGPSRWKPSNTDYHCSYAVSWVSVASAWGLSMDKADVDAIREMLKTC